MYEANKHTNLFSPIQFYFFNFNPSWNEFVFLEKSFSALYLYFENPLFSVKLKTKISSEKKEGKFKRILQIPKKREIK